MKKTWIAIAVIGLKICGANAYTFDWFYAGSDLNNQGRGTFTTGWLVQLYRDNGTVSQLSTVSGFTGEGLPIGTGTGDDTLLAGYTSSVQPGFGGVKSWYKSPNDYSTIIGASVYSVIFNASSLLNNPTQGLIIDSSPFTLPVTDQDAYQGYGNTLTGISGQWQAVPEPGTMALMGLGVVILGVRRFSLKL